MRLPIFTRSKLKAYGEVITKKSGMPLPSLCFNVSDVTCSDGQMHKQTLDLSSFSPLSPFSVLFFLPMAVREDTQNTAVRKSVK
jgi:hypothetical protein